MALTGGERFAGAGLVVAWSLSPTSTRWPPRCASGCSSESARDGSGDVDGRIRALVDREAALLDAGAREELVARVAERSFGLGPLEPLLRDPGVDEVMVNGAGPVWVERARAPGGDRRALRLGEASCATRSSGSSRRWVAAWTRPSRSATRGCPTARASTW